MAQNVRIVPPTKAPTDSRGPTNLDVSTGNMDLRNVDQEDNGFENVLWETYTGATNKIEDLNRLVFDLGAFCTQAENRNIHKTIKDMAPAMTAALGEIIREMDKL